MRDIQPIGPAGREGGYGTLHGVDVDRTLAGLRPGNRYSAKDLHARYSDAATEAGRQPAHPVSFGQELARRGLHRCSVMVAGKQVAAWRL